MDRRSTLATLIGRPQQVQKNLQLNGDFTPYTGDWNYQTAGHLLRRTVFGPTHEMIRQAVADGLEATLDKLFDLGPLPDPPINYFYQDDPDVAVGETWVNAPFNANSNFSRKVSLRAWMLRVIEGKELSIREKLTIFWHNHFVVADTNDARHIYTYINYLRENALGNFRDMVKYITIDPSMLVYLNGTQSTRFKPNENYARELLELFAIGKGPLAGDGDYTHYTEDDVREIAKALTGWIFRDRDTEEIGAVFVPNRHETADKQLSHRFGNKVITNAAEEEYKNVVDIIFEQDEVARFISRKLYRWFVHFQIDETVESDVIEPMAQLIRDNDYEIAPALRALLSSSFFFESDLSGCMIKNPLDFLYSMTNTLQAQFPEDILDNYRTWRNVYDGIKPMEMIIFEHPTVAGWKPYYQEPAYHRIWINSASLPVRSGIVNFLVSAGSLDVLGVVGTLENNLEVNAMLKELSDLVFPRPLTEAQLTYLKDVLLPGLPDFEWTLEYEIYLKDPDDEEKRTALEAKLRDLFTAMLSLPEFHLM